MPLGFTLAALLVALPAPSRGEETAPQRHPVDEAKKAGRTIGHAARDSGKAVGHGAATAGKGIARGAKQAGHEIGRGAREIGHGVRDAVKGK